MSIIEVTTRITHKYLMNKTKWELASWILEDCDKIDDLIAERDNALAELEAYKRIMNIEPSSITTFMGKPIKYWIGLDAKLEQAKDDMKWMIENMFDDNDIQMVFDAVAKLEDA